MLVFDYLSLKQIGDHNFKHALARFQFGDLAAALQLLDSATATHGLPEYALLKGAILRYISSEEVASPVSLFWHVSPALWEGDWLRMILQGTYAEEAVDFDRKAVSRRMIVVDNQLGPEKETYYRNAFENGCRICLIHLSDESFRDDLSSYRWCELVYRNYWSPLIAGFHNVRAFPLGYKIGFSTSDAPVPSTERPLVWSFAGDPNKTTRREMLASMSNYAPGEIHLTSGFHAADNLSVKQYQALLKKSIFAPCPQGNVNLDSYRVYEALECGCIPIVEKRRGFDYFTHLLGRHPIPVVEDWSAAPGVANAILEQDGGLLAQRFCQDWWSRKKSTLRQALAEHIGEALR